MSSVRLQSLAIQGFKSFATRTLLEFAPGVTAIVGPNGSGKSNVADAIRWVLGSQSPRALRIASAEDVVFASGNGRAPAGLADVQLTLNNEDTWLPVAFREVVVGRRAFRSGESEYILNKSRVRLRDLLELLAHGGLGPDGHALVAQGLADQALSLKPAQRRELFEGASGVRQYRLQRAEAEHKIAEARRNAARVADLVAELKPRVAGAAPPSAADRAGSTAARAVASDARRVAHPRAVGGRTAAYRPHGRRHRRAGGAGGRR